MTSETVRGFRDIEGEEAEKRQEIREILADVFQSYCYEPIETPIIEYEEFVKGNNQNDEAVSDIFKLKDKGERNLALRYEFTFQLKRLANGKKLPFKRYQIGEVFRDEPIGANRFRQFTQCDIDIIGASVKDEAEILAVVKDVFQKLNIKNEIYVNNRKLINEILEANGIKNGNKYYVMKEIDKLDKLPEKEIKNNLRKYNAEKIINVLKNKESYFKKFQAYKEIQELKKYCDYYNVKVIFRPFLVRGLSYYNRSVFEVKTTDRNFKETICAGGSYMVNNIQASGISFGLDRLASLAKLESKKKKCLIISIDQDKEAIKLAEKLRKANIDCMILFGKPSKALDYANSKKINSVIFIGEQEVKSKKYTLKDMKSGKESKVNEKEFIKRLS